MLHFRDIDPLYFNKWMNTRHALASSKGGMMAYISLAMRVLHTAWLLYSPEDLTDSVPRGRISTAQADLTM